MDPVCVDRLLIAFWRALISGAVAVASGLAGSAVVVPAIDYDGQWSLFFFFFHEDEPILGSRRSSCPRRF